MRDPIFLDSSSAHPLYGRYSVFAAMPQTVLTLNDGQLRDTAGNVLAAGAQELWPALARAFSPACDISPCQRELPYFPGWYGFIGYEIGRYIERLPCKAPMDLPLGQLRLGFYSSVLVYDNLTRSWTLRTLAAPSGRQTDPAADALRDMLTSSQPAAAGPPRQVSAGEIDELNWRSNFTPDEYRHAVRRCIDYIAAGDVFQVNLSQRLCVNDPPPPLEIYNCLRRRNPCWHGAFMSFDSGGGPCAILSSSPELFLRLRDGVATTRPIKGTRPRTGDASADRCAAADLLASPKDNAELAMIIDLLRNDLGRVCDFGSVKVLSPRELEEHPTVWHLTGTIQGLPRSGVGVAEILRATLPGGSITGAPKIRAMEIIDELEPCARGVYTGLIGCAGVDGSCEWNIAIRTIVCDSRTAYVQVGGGVVADSEPDLEYRETLDKARALLEAISMARLSSSGSRSNITP